MFTILSMGFLINLQSLRINKSINLNYLFSIQTDGQTHIRNMQSNFTEQNVFYLHSYIIHIFFCNYISAFFIHICKYGCKNICIYMLMFYNFVNTQRIAQKICSIKFKSAYLYASNNQIKVVFKYNYENIFFQQFQSKYTI